MVFEPVQNKVSIQGPLFFRMKFKIQIMILHISKHFLTNFQYVIITSCVNDKMYI